MWSSSVRGRVDSKAIVLADGLSHGKKNPHGTLGNRNRDLPTFSAITQPAAPPRVRRLLIRNKNDPSSFPSGYNWRILVNSSYRLCFVAVPSTVWCSSRGMIGYLFIPDTTVGTEGNDI